MNKYQFTNEMAEISGMGGDYEGAVRRMVVAGLEWLDANPKADPRFHEKKHVTGLVWEDNEDAKALSDVVAKSEPECSGAMHHYAIRHIMWIKSKGWDKYVEVKTKQKQEEDLVNLEKC